MERTENISDDSNTTNERNFTRIKTHQEGVKIASIDPGSGAIDLGNVTSERQGKNTSLFNQPLPTLDSDKSILLDIFGVSRTISIEGIFTGTASQLNTFIVAMETINSGTQTGSTFVSSLSTFSNKTVFMNDFSWNFIAGSPNKIDYSIELLEGASVT